MRNQLADWSEAAESNWEVTVVGAGPAGIVAARQLAQRGVRVLLLDRQQFPRPKVCGGCLNRRATHHLRELGFSDRLDAIQGHPLRRFELHTGRRSIEIPLSGGLALSRERLDDSLLQQAIADGVHFLPGIDARVEPIDPKSNHREISCRTNSGGPRLVTSIVIIATGLAAEPMLNDQQLNFEQMKGSRVGVQVSINDFPDCFQPGTITMTVGRQGYVGLTRTEGTSLNLAAALDRTSLRGATAAEVCRDIVSDCGLPFPDSAMEASWKGTCGLTRRRRPAGTRLFVVGDAGGYVEPFTGEGMEMAIASGHAVVDIAQAAILDWRPEMEMTWSRQFHRLVTRRQWICRGLSHILRHPFLLRTAFSATSCFPPLGRAVAHMVS